MRTAISSILVKLIVVIIVIMIIGFVVKGLGIDPFTLLVKSLKPVFNQTNQTIQEFNQTIK